MPPRTSRRVPSSAARTCGDSRRLLTLEQRGDVRGAYAALDAAADAATDEADIVRLALARAEMWLGHQGDPASATVMLDDAEACVPAAHDVILPARILHALCAANPKPRSRRGAGHAAR